MRYRKVWRALTRLDTSKAANGIPPVFLKECATVLAAPLTRLFRMIVKHGRYPSRWAIGRVTPVHKRGSVAEPANYRPMTTLDNVSMVSETCIYDQFES